LGFKFFCFLLKRIPHQVISISESIKDQYPKGLKERIKVIYNGINISDLREPNLEDFYKRLGTNRKDIVVGAVGRFNFIKGFHVYIEAIRLIQKDISNVCFVLIGPDNIEYEKEYLDEIKNMIKNKGLNKKVFILGAFKKANMFMNALDILVLPTVSNEGFGNVVLEAQAIGIPVIASNCGGPNEVVRDKISGYIVEKNNPKAIAVKLLKLLKDSNTRMEMAQRAKDENFINKFSLKNSIAMIEDVYNNL
jgi:glycosyltransferase involved in cell wall biosynthesis